MIIIKNFLLFQLGDYIGSKSEISPFQLEDVAFSCGWQVFAETATEADFQASTFITLMLPY